MADVFRDDCVVCGPVVEMQVDGLVAAVLGRLMMLVSAWPADNSVIKEAGFVGTDGGVPMDNDVVAHLDCDGRRLFATPTVVGDGAGIGGSDARCRNRVLRCWVIQRVGGRPAVAVVARATCRQGMKRG